MAEKLPKILLFLIRISRLFLLVKKKAYLFIRTNSNHLLSVLSKSPTIMLFCAYFPPTQFFSSPMRSCDPTQPKQRSLILRSSPSTMRLRYMQTLRSCPYLLHPNWTSRQHGGQPGSCCSDGCYCAGYRPTRQMHTCCGCNYINSPSCFIIMILASLSTDLRQRKCRNKSGLD